MLLSASDLPAGILARDFTHGLFVLGNMVAVPCDRKVLSFLRTAGECVFCAEPSMAPLFFIQGE